MDGLREYMSKEFNAFLKYKGIIHQCTTPYTPQQNDMAGRKNRSVMEISRCMLNGKKLPHKFSVKAFMCTNYVFDKGPTKAFIALLHIRRAMAQISSEKAG